MFYEKDRLYKIHLKLMVIQLGQKRQVEFFSA